MITNLLIVVVAVMLMRAARHFIGVYQMMRQKCWRVQVWIVTWSDYYELGAAALTKAEPIVWFVYGDIDLLLRHHLPRMGDNFGTGQVVGYDVTPV